MLDSISIGVIYKDIIRCLYIYGFMQRRVAILSLHVPETSQIPIHISWPARGNGFPRPRDGTHTKSVVFVQVDARNHSNLFN